MSVTVATTILLGPPVPLDPAGFVCPDGSVVTVASQCPTTGNKVAPIGPPGSFPGSGGGGGGGTGGGGLIGVVGRALHGLTGGLL